MWVYHSLLKYSKKTHNKQACWRKATHLQPVQLYLDFSLCVAKSHEDTLVKSVISAITVSTKGHAQIICRITLGHTLQCTGEKPYKCNQCDYTCTQSGTMKTHKMTHTRVRPFKWTNLQNVHADWSSHKALIKPFDKLEDICKVHPITMDLNLHQPFQSTDNNDQADIVKKMINEWQHSSREIVNNRFEYILQWCNQVRALNRSNSNFFEQNSFSNICLAIKM